MNQIELTWEQWQQEYQPFTDRFNTPYMFETYGNDLATVEKSGEGLVWTFIETDNGTMITNGQHYVNRLGYYITNKPALPDTEYEIDYYEYQED